MSVYKSLDHRAPRGHVRQPSALAQKVTQASTPLQLVAFQLCHKDYDIITLERSERERKNNSLHPSVNVHLKLLLNQSLVKINREWLGGGLWKNEKGKGGSVDACWKTEQ